MNRSIFFRYDPVHDPSWQRVESNRCEADPPESGSRGSLLRDIGRSALHRIDAWGVALIVCSVALLVHDVVTLDNLLLVLAVTVCYALGYAVNDYFDAHFDRQEAAKAKLNVFVRHRISAVWATVFFAVALVFPLAVFARLGARGLPIFATCTLVIWSYSAPPLRLKARPGLDLLTHALFVQTFAYFICVFLIGAEWLRIDGWILSINFLSSLSGQLSQQVRDFELDSRTETNFATSVGRPAAIRCLRGVTATLVAAVAFGFTTGALPLILAPLPAAFVFAMASRLRGGGSAPSPAQVYLPTTAAMAYVGILLFGALGAS